MILSFTSQKNLCHNTQIPYKKSKNKPPAQDQKDHNRALSKARVKIASIQLSPLFDQFKKTFLPINF